MYSLGLDTPLGEYPVNGTLTFKLSEATAAAHNTARTHTHARTHAALFVPAAVHTLSLGLEALPVVIFRMERGAILSVEQC